MFNFDAGRAPALLSLDLAKRRADQVVPGVQDALRAQTRIQHPSGARGIEIEDSGQQHFWVGSSLRDRSHRRERCRPGVGALADQVAHVSHYRDVGLAVEPMRPGRCLGGPTP